ncbi:putative F-box/kelch-repeat protein [Sesbania bispinosa]|nr:putative F-box/kelch-repeat protein [Sesbania bispinosa]
MNIQKRLYSDAPAALSSPAATTTVRCHSGQPSRISYNDDEQHYPLIFFLLTKPKMTLQSSPLVTAHQQRPWTANARETRSIPASSTSVERHNREPNEALSELCQRPDDVMEKSSGVTYTFECVTKKWQRLYDLRPVPTRRKRVLLHHRNREEPFGGGGDDWRCRKREGSEVGLGLEYWC